MYLDQNEEESKNLEEIIEYFHFLEFTDEYNDKIFGLLNMTILKSVLFDYVTGLVKNKIQIKKVMSKMKLVNMQTEDFKEFKEESQKEFLIFVLRGHLTVKIKEKNDSNDKLFEFEKHLQSKKCLSNSRCQKNMKVNPNFEKNESNTIPPGQKFDSVGIGKIEVKEVDDDMLSKKNKQLNIILQNFKRDSSRNIQKMNDILLTNHRRALKRTTGISTTKFQSNCKLSFAPIPLPQISYLTPKPGKLIEESIFRKNQVCTEIKKTLKTGNVFNNLYLKGNHYNDQILLSAVENSYILMISANEIEEFLNENKTEKIRRKKEMLNEILNIGKKPEEMKIIDNLVYKMEVG